MFIRKVQSNLSFWDATQLNLLLRPIFSLGLILQKTKGSGNLCKMNCCFQTRVTFNGAAMVELEF